jgi:hypothetical protein
MLYKSLFAEIRCGDVGRSTGALVTDQTGDNYEDVVTLHCRHGYHRETGSELRTCLGRGAWSGTPLVCARTATTLYVSLSITSLAKIAHYLKD